MITTLVAVCVAGGVGAALRFVLDGVIRAATERDYPIGTTVINLTGSLLLGVVTGLAVRGVAPESLHAVLGTGLLGGYTTFSAASFETVRLLEQRRLGAALANGVGQLVVATGAATAGYAAAALIG